MMNMVKMICTVQENFININDIKDIEAVTADIYKKHFGNGYKLIPIWIQIPSGQAYLTGQQSKASAVLIPVKNGLSNALRHDFMKELCHAWMVKTGYDKDQIILNAPDEEYSSQLTKQMLLRIRPTKRPLVSAKIVSTLALSKIAKGYYTMSVNL